MRGACFAVVTITTTCFCSFAVGNICIVSGALTTTAVTTVMTHLASGPTEGQVHLFWKSLQVPGREQEMASSLSLRGRHLQHRSLRKQTGEGNPLQTSNNPVKENHTVTLKTLR